MSTKPTVPKPPRGYRLLATATAAQRKAAGRKREGDLAWCSRGWIEIIVDRSRYYKNTIYARRVTPKRSPSPRKKAGSK